MTIMPRPPHSPRSFRSAFAVILGTNEIASAIAVDLHRAGWSAVLSHDPHPPVIRRQMAFHDALFGDCAELEGVKARYAETTLATATLLGSGDCVAVTRLGLLDLIPMATVHLLVDARMQDRAIVPDIRHLASITVGVGPGFSVGENCDIAIETQPTKNGITLFAGRTAAPASKERRLGAVGSERFAIAKSPGRWHCAVEIGTRVFRNFPVGLLNREAVTAPIDGIVRGIVRDGTEVFAGTKILEIDPRGRSASWEGVDKGGRDIAQAIITALTYGQPRPAKVAAAKRFSARQSG
ncbi:xanthine dehydrogenase [Rhodomicrobium sp. Az07]|uniref:xanthine dehydrogenase n=1 Tax=Rhodomicrobium sp. Az07 TaxID=2839034 RepID=UPI002036CF39|nr:xanthine dehydrogenase [Rhodomicrobium sp. Az07]